MRTCGQCGEMMSDGDGHKCARRPMTNDQIEKAIRVLINSDMALLETIKRLMGEGGMDKLLVMRDHLLNECGLSLDDDGRLSWAAGCDCGVIIKEFYECTAIQLEAPNATKA